MSPPAVVALGGGHGLHASLRAARTISEDVTAVVTVADDGGSSGRLRRELGTLPPGDLRMALSALADGADAAQLWSRTIQHRFAGTGELAGHAVGNLLLAGLTEVLGDPVAAIEQLGRLLGIRGRVLPMSTVPLDIEADVVGLAADPRVSTAVRGQHAVAVTTGQVRRVRLLPEDPPACPQAVAAVREADLLVLGPGSWFSSVIPHLRVPQLLEAILTTGAVRVAVLNLAPEAGETTNFTMERHLHVLSQHAPGLRLDAVVVDERSLQPGESTGHLDRAAADLGARVHVADVAVAGTKVHDETRLGAVLAAVLRQGRAAVQEQVDGEEVPAWR